MSPNSLVRVVPLAMLMALVALAGGAEPAEGASFTVDATHDAVDAAPGDGVCADAGGACTLRAAVMETNALAGADEISLPAGTYVLSIAGADEDAAATGDLDVTDDLTITGEGRDVTIIDGAQLDRVLHLSPTSFQGVNTTISGVTIRNGRASGAELAGNGGGIHAANGGGTLNVSESAIVDNAAAESGGGIDNYGSTFMTLTNSLVSGNTAREAGGILGFARIYDSTITNNSAEFAGGGILAVNIEITRSTIAGNNARQGGGIWISAFRGRFDEVLIAGNTATNAGGGIHNHIGSEAVTLRNVTITGNSAPLGGGISNSRSYNAGSPAQLSITNATISFNSAPIGAGIFNDDEVRLDNTILALNAGGPNCSGPIVSGGHNMSNDNSCPPLNGPGDFPNTNPRLGPLAANGGPTHTHALLAGSPAIDAADNADCPATDQRGVPRPFDGNNDGSPTCDIGAFEHNQQSGTITIIKDAIPDSSTLFAFAVTEGSCPPFPCQGSTFNLDDDNTDRFPRSTSFGAGPGMVEVQESSAPSEWTLAAIACDDGSRVDLGSRKAFVDVAPGETVTCTFTNGLGEGAPIDLPPTGGNPDSPAPIELAQAAIALPTLALAAAVGRRVARRAFTDP